MRLEADKVIQRTVGIVLPELHHGVGFTPGMRIAQPDRLHRPVSQRIKAAARHDLDRHAAFKHAAVVKAVNRRFAGGRKLLPESGVFFLGHRAVYIICRPLVVPGGTKGAFHINGIERYDRSNGVIKVQPLAAGAAKDVLRERVRGEGPAGNDDFTIGNIHRLFLNDLHIGKGADGLGHGAGEALTVHRQRAAGGHAVLVRAAHYDAAEPAQLFFEKSHGICKLIAAQRIGAHKLRKIWGDMCRGHFFRLHFDQPYRDTPGGELISRFGTGKTGADNRYSVHLSSFGVSFFSVLSAADSCGFSAVLSAAALRR